jgi:hypothetical protein
MQNTSDYTLTNHSKIRADQRGIQSEVINAVWHFADVEQPRPGKCFELSISRRTLKLLVRKGRMNPQLADKCRRAKLLTDGAVLITVYKNDN